ncbi:MAG: protoporphyrinogen oxidase-like protein, partial [Acidimicrobiales bacterium]
TFGPALCARFFFPFHQRYTAGLYRGLAAQDPQKSPRREPGYNPTYRYPVGGLDVLIRGLAEPVDLRCAMAVTAIDLEAESLHLADGSEHRYADLVSTLDPMATLALCGAKGEAAVARLGEPDPFTSVLVSNLGGQRGPACPDDHWIYDPESRSGSHRYGIYSNVDASFVPREDPDRVAIYVEHGFRGGDRPSPQAAASILQADVRELQDRGVLGEVEVADPSWVEVAYTWRRPGSTWATDAASALAAVGVTQVGRYGRWHFQGIAESIGEGLAVGASLVADRSMA